MDKIIHQRFWKLSLLISVVFIALWNSMAIACIFIVISSTVSGMTFVSLFLSYFCYVSMPGISSPFQMFKEGLIEGDDKLDSWGLVVLIAFLIIMPLSCKLHDLGLVPDFVVTLFKHYCNCIDIIMNAAVDFQELFRSLITSLCKQ